MEEVDTISIKDIVEKKIGVLDNFPYKVQIQQSIIDVIQYKLDGAKKHVKQDFSGINLSRETDDLSKGQILVDAPSDETRYKPKEGAMWKNIGNTMSSPFTGSHRMLYHSKDKSANLNDVILNSIKRAKTGECFTFGKHFRTTGTSNLDSHDAKIFTEFCIYATYNLYEALTNELNTDIKKADSDKSGKKQIRDDKNNSIQKDLNKTDILIV